MRSRRLRRRLFATRYEQERGVVAIFTAIILSAILIGVGALAVDTGVLFTERRQAQNAADAAALSVAESCAASTTGCTDVTGNPQQWATNNAKASMAGITVTQVCGTDGLGPCPTGDTGKLPDCPTLTTTPAHYAEVHVVATNDVRAFKIRPGDGNDPAACSRVEWGPAGSVTTVIPFTIGACEFANATGVTGDPPVGGHFPSSPVAIALNYKNGAACSTWNGHDFPGGFGWLNSNVNCQATIKVGDWAPVTPGMSNGGKCKNQIAAAAAARAVVYLPVYDCVSANDVFCDNVGHGSGTDYHIAGLAAFQLDGFSAPSYGSLGDTSTPSCDGKANACIYGRFLKGLVPVGSIDPTAPDMGVSALNMIG